ncbi:C2 family cysteine protease (plasmid) [Streptomyces sp. NBC_01450]|uniref:C2 family cysteine protease n=1 Tax=Streptomyces sp. NBC_01450 TaxID=2903871 RepID=UPI002E31C912|nr:C2 family cysteine protease [Streptomyces sp. NBC_01450]
MSTPSSEPIARPSSVAPSKRLQDSVHRNGFVVMQMNTPGLFRDGGMPNFTDVKQGKLDDCWAMASLAAIAHKNSAYIRDMITPNERGGFTVSLNSDIDVRPNVLVAQSMQREGVVPLTANALEVSWVALTEKALAKAMTPSGHGFSYEKLDAGENVENGFAHLGIESHTLKLTKPALPKTLEKFIGFTKINDYNGEAVNFIENALNANQPLIAGTWDGAENLENAKLTPGHAYAILGRHREQNANGYLLYDPTGKMLFVDAATIRHDFSNLASTVNIEKDRLKRFGARQHALYQEGQIGQNFDGASRAASGNFHGNYTTATAANYMPVSLGASRVTRQYPQGVRNSGSDHDLTDSLQQKSPRRS